MPPEAIPVASSTASWSAIGTAALLVLIVACALLSGGCATITKQLDSLPAGSAQEVHYTRTGKFSSTTIIARGYAKDEKQTTVTELSVRHSNAWMPNLEIVAKGYQRIRSGPYLRVPVPTEPSLRPFRDEPVSDYPFNLVPPPPAAPSAPLEVKAQ